MCQICFVRPARFRLKNGQTKKRSDHDLCEKCWRDLCESLDDRKRVQKNKRSGDE